MRFAVLIAALLSLATASAQFIIGSGGRGDETFNELWCVSDQDLAHDETSAGAGAWGPRVTNPCATRPTTTRSSSCSTRSSCDDALDVDGALVTLTGTGFSGNVNIEGDDVDWIIPPTATLTGAIIIGSSGPCGGGALTRIRIRGPTANTGSSAGSNNGGLVGEIRALSCASNVTIDGIQSNGDGSLEMDYGCLRTEAATAVTLVWFRCRAGAAGGYTSAGMILNHVSFDTAVSTQATTGANGWTLRGGGPISIYNSDMRGHSHTTIRLHEDAANSPEFVGVLYNNTLMNDGEARVIRGFTDAADGSVNDDTGPGDGLILDSNDIYAYSNTGCIGSSLPIDTPFSRFDNNRFYNAGISDHSQAMLDSAQAAAPSGTHTDTGNNFSTWTVMPAWGGAGDPTGIPMPAGQVAATTGRGGASCTFSGL